MAAEVLILIGSESDGPRMEEAAKVLQAAGVAADQVVASAHREPQRVIELVREAEGRGIRVIIAGAGLAAHLPGFVAAHTRLPVIGVPLSVGVLQGMDALLSIVQMPSGVPVATVGIDNARNAAHLALRILGKTQEVPP